MPLWTLHNYIHYNTPTMEEVIPAALMNKEELGPFLAWVRGLPIDQEGKKQLVMLWTDRVGVKLTGDMLIRAGIERR